MKLAGKISEIKYNSKYVKLHIGGIDMSQMRYMISDAAKLVDVEAHVLRYWEEELEFSVGRNEMKHRYYTEENIRLFQKIKELKEQGIQLKAIKGLLPNLKDEKTELTTLVKEQIFPEGQALVEETERKEDKMGQFQHIMGRLISEAFQDNTKQLGKEISDQVSNHVIKEMDYLLRLKEEREDQQFKKLDEAIRNSQKNRKKLALIENEREQKKKSKRSFRILRKEKSAS